jgi:cell division protein FtsW
VYFIKKQFKSFVQDSNPDYFLLILVSLLMTIGILFSYSLSIYTVNYYDYNQFHFFIREFLSGILAILIMWTFAHLNPDKTLPKVGWSLFGIFFFLMAVMPFLPESLVTKAGGASRWIRLPGLSLSPIEFFKIGFIYFLADSFQRILMQHNNVPFLKELKLLLPYGVVFLIVVFLVAVLQKDLGQVVVLGGILTVLLMFANRSYKLFAFLIGIVIFGVVILVVIAPHRILRIQTWWSGIQDSMLSLPFVPDFVAQALRVKDVPEPYQVLNSLSAIYHGSLFGTGIGSGGLKLGFLSEVHTDFVLAGITEEIGFLGLCVIVLLFTMILIRIFKISRRVQSTKYHLFTLGIGLMIIFAFLINSYGISAIIPIKGIAVPFLSYGGSSLISNAIAIGLVLSISNKMPKEAKI